MSEFTDELDDSVMICPYCKHEYQPEGEDYSEDENIEECSDCGMKYYMYQSFSVTHHSTPDCKLNNKEHKWEAVELGNDKGSHDFCSVCDKCRRYSE